MLEHVFIGELLRSLWMQGVADVEVLRPEVDASGYDVAIECRDHLRHIQLKTSFINARTQSVTVSMKLAAKPSGCVIWVFFNRDTLQPTTFRWFGNAPGVQLRRLEEYPLAKQVRANSAGVKAVRPNVRCVPKRDFDQLETMGDVAKRLFGSLIQ